jgi:hypothetical protein
LERSARPTKTDSDEFDVLSLVGEILSRIAEIILPKIAKLGSKPFRRFQENHRDGLSLSNTLQSIRQALSAGQ